MSKFHKLADIASSANVDSSAAIGAFTVIESGVQIGPDVEIGPLCRIWSGTTIGAGCIIQSGAMIGGPPQDRGFRGERSFCEIGDGTEIREHVTVHRGTGEGSYTRVGRNCLLMANAHVGHNCALADEVTLVNGALLGGYVQVGRRAILSGHVAVHQFSRIGEAAMIGVLSKITQDIIPYFMTVGDGFIAGINRIGLRRMGATSADIDSIQHAYRILCRQAHSLPVARALLAESSASPYVQTILSFLSVESRRGFHLHPPPTSARCHAENNQQNSTKDEAMPGGSDVHP